MDQKERIPPAVNEVFVKLASDVCDRAEVDYDEWLTNSQELVVHLQERWREGIDESGLNLNTDDAQNRAIQLFGTVSEVSKSLRKPPLKRLLETKRYRPERLMFFVIGYLFYTFIVVFDKNWRVLYQQSDVIPLKIFLPDGIDLYRNGLGIILVGFAAIACVFAAQWQPRVKSVWLNQALQLRYSLLFLPGIAIFSVTIHSTHLAINTISGLMRENSDFDWIFRRVFVLNSFGVFFGCLGAVCLFFEIAERDWKSVRVYATIAGVLFGAFLTLGLYSGS